MTQHQEARLPCEAPISGVVGTPGAAEAAETAWTHNGQLIDVISVAASDVAGVAALGHR